jgi:Uma2 family endonuclease
MRQDVADQAVDRPHELGVRDEAVVGPRRRASAPADARAGPAARDLEAPTPATAMGHARWNGAGEAAVRLAPASGCCYARSAMSQPQRRYSLADYFAIEAMSPVRHEFYRGEIFAMAGASLEHNLITVNVLTMLKIALDPRCNVFGSDLRIATPGGLYTYPDVSVICGKVTLLSRAPDTATNPLMLVEVLSDATRDYDRGEKFDLYKTIRSVRDYVLIDQDRVAVDHFTRRGTRWAKRSTASLSAKVALRGMAVDLSVKDAYRGVL